MKFKVVLAVLSALIAFGVFLPRAFAAAGASSSPARGVARHDGGPAAPAFQQRATPTDTSAPGRVQPSATLVPPTSVAASVVTDTPLPMRQAPTSTSLVVRQLPTATDTALPRNTPTAPFQSFKSDETTSTPEAAATTAPIIVRPTAVAPAGSITNNPTALPAPSPLPPTASPAPTATLLPAATAPTRAGTTTALAPGASVSLAALNLLALLAVSLALLFYQRRQARALEHIEHTADAWFAHQVRLQREVRSQENLVLDPLKWIADQIRAGTGERPGRLTVQRVSAECRAVELLADDGRRVVVTPLSLPELARWTQARKGRLAQFAERPLLAGSRGVVSVERSLMSAGNYFDIEAAQAGKLLDVPGWENVARLWFYLTPPAAGNNGAGSW